jgi:hypothetical protein
MYELMWDVSKFTDKSIWPDSGPAFMYSMNLGYVPGLPIPWMRIRQLTTPTSGSAAHGDYVFGWEGDSLQKAMDKGCNLNRDCPAAGLTAQTPEKYNACTIKQQAPEPVDGCKSPYPAHSYSSTTPLAGLTDSLFSHNRAQGHAYG